MRRRFSKDLERLRKQIDSATKDYHSESNHQQSDIARAIEALVDHYKADSDRGSRIQEQTLFWTKGAFWGLMCYTGVTFALALIGHDANVLNADSGRAWVGPQDSILSAPLALGHGVSTLTTYRDFGRDPGIDLSIVLRFRDFRLSEWNDGTADRYIINFSSNCLNERKYTRGTRIAFPTGGSSYQFSIDTDKPDTWIGSTKPFVIDEDFLSGAKTVVFLQCYVYRTEGHTRHTAGCYSADKNVTDQHLHICASGNDAD